MVLDGIDFSLGKGETVAIIGPSGSGKTTILRCISFLEKALEGHMIFGEDSLEMKSASKGLIKELRMRMGFVFQSFNLFNNMTVMENVMEGLITARKVEKEAAKKTALECLKKVGLSEQIDKYPSQLSGGQQQRTAIARALALNPEVIFFDEPTSALDPELTAEVLTIIKQLSDEGVTMLIVTHEMDFAREVADRIIFVEAGKVVEDSGTREFFENPKSERTREFITSRGKKTCQL